jgi:cyclophilin family peptidyl-prolyl cis-trans isomerase/HEAT repeat protein
VLPGKVLKMRRARGVLWLALVAMLAPPAAAQAPLEDRMLAAEDRRGTSEADLAPLVEGLGSKQAGPRRQAVRALGRFERPELIPLIAPMLNDGVGIRAEAAGALAQLARTPAAAGEVQSLLLARAALDAEAGLWEVWGEMAAALGRLPYESPEQVALAEDAIVEQLPSPDSLAEFETSAISGAIRGLESLARISRKVGTLQPRTWDRIRWAATAQRPPADPRSAWIRRLAMAALVTGGEATPSVIERALADKDAEVRRLGALAAGGDREIAERDRLLKIALADESAQVRLEGLRAWGRHLQSTSCPPIRARVKDADPHVRLQAIDLLGAPCAAADGPTTEVAALVETLSTRSREWHAPAHALVALARQAPDRAREALPRFRQHPTWQVRMYAARTAGILKDVEALTALAADVHHNVREAALLALIELKQPEAVAAGLSALASDDYQLVLTATRAFEDAASAPKAVPALLSALARLTAERKDTSRDPRMAILFRMETLGSKAQVEAITGYLQDFDPRVAEKAAELLRAWTGAEATPSPRPLARPEVTRADVDEVRGARLRITMAGLGTFDIALDVDLAALSAVRIARRAAEGYYNGLTFHRVASNFVIQGGSPGANEYAGDAIFMRDEVGLHRRETVGVSTRGRDTGDAQIFVNLVDSPRLDHQYTVFGTVVSGMDVVDAILEGDVIERIEIVKG